MHIKGNGLPTREIELHLKPVNTRFVLAIRPLGALPPLRSDIPPEDWFANRAVIHFEDTHEIDTLIDMLERFRDENKAYFGEWRKIP